MYGCGACDCERSDLPLLFVEPRLDDTVETVDLISQKIATVAGACDGILIVEPMTVSASDLPESTPSRKAGVRLGTSHPRRRVSSSYCYG